MTGPPGSASGRFDVVVVGARCAGAPLAAALADAGRSVALVERAAALGDTASTHFVQGEGIACLGRLGVIDSLLASGAPWIERAHMRLAEVSVTVEWPRRPDDPGPALCVRRHVLDPLLLERAARAGVDVRLGARVTSLVDSNGRVGGVEAEIDGRTETLTASLVVGADGRSSTVARLVGARRYHVVPNSRFAYWGYYEDASWEPPAAVFTQRWDDQFVVACPTDGDLYLVIAYPPLDRLEAFHADADAAFDAVVASCPPVAEVIASGRRVGRLHGLSRYEAFFRESAGPGWALVGDAGHFKDPAPGQGIADALRQAERLAEAVLGSYGAGAASLDRALRRWWRRRDRDEAGMHWFAADMGADGVVPVVLQEIVRHRLGQPGGARHMFEVFNQRVAPAEVLTPARLATAAARLLGAGAPPRPQLASELKEIVGREVVRRFRSLRPVYEPLSAS